MFKRDRQYVICTIDSEKKKAQSCRPGSVK
jgi:hypothetical protein